MCSSCLLSIYKTVSSVSEPSITRYCIATKVSTCLWLTQTFSFFQNIASETENSNLHTLPHFIGVILCKTTDYHFSFFVLNFCSSGWCTQREVWWRARTSVLGTVVTWTSLRGFPLLICLEGLKNQSVTLAGTVGGLTELLPYWKRHVDQ